MTKKQILIVDDHHDICASMRDILEHEGYLVDVAHCGDEAMKMARLRKPDHVLLDYQMPGMNGGELFAKIKLLHPQVVGFLITAYADSSGVNDAQNHGVNAVFQKPIDVARFLTAIRNTTSN